MDYLEFRDIVIIYAKSLSLSEYELYYNESTNVSVEIYKEEVKSFSSAINGGVGFRCIVRGKMGYASTELFTEEEAKSLVKRAMENAESIESEDEVFIYGGNDSYQEVNKKPYEVPSADLLINTALDIQKELYKNDSRIVDGTQTMTAAEKTAVSICNSKGLDAKYETSIAIAYAQPIVAVGEEMFTSDAYVMQEIEAVDKETLAKKAVEDTIAEIGAGKVESGKYNLVFSPKTMASLLRTFSSVFSAEEVQRGTSLLKDKENETIASPLVTIVDDPFYPSSFYQVPFDAEGVATYTKNVIDQGTLKTFLHNLKTAKKSNTKTTGNASKRGYAGAIEIMPYNFFIKPVKGTKEDLFMQVKEGIYITSLEGMHAGANPVTGDFSLASSGFLIHEGKKEQAVKGFTVSGNFYELLKKIEIVGEDIEFVLPYGSYAMFGAPSVMVKDMSIAGQ